MLASLSSTMKPIPRSNKTFVSEARGIFLVLKFVRPLNLQPQIQVLPNKDHSSMNMQNIRSEIVYMGLVASVLTSLCT